LKSLGFLKSTTSDYQKTYDFLILAKFNDCPVRVFHNSCYGYYVDIQEISIN